MDKAKVSRAVATLLKRGLIEREAHQTDQRLIQLTLSKAGRKIYEAIIPRARAIEAEVTMGLSKADIAQLHKALDRIGARLDEIELVTRPACLDERPFASARRFPSRSRTAGSAARVLPRAAPTCRSAGRRACHGLVESACDDGPRLVLQSIETSRLLMRPAAELDKLVGQQTIDRAWRGSTSGRNRLSSSSRRTAAHHRSSRLLFALQQDEVGHQNKSPGVSAGAFRSEDRWISYASFRLPAACLPRSLTTSKLTF